MGSIASRWVLGAGVAAALGALAPAGVGAQPAPGTPAPAAGQEAARNLVVEAIAAQEAGDHDKAIELYQKAFALAPHPSLLLSIGRAHRLAGRSEQAVQFYELYLQFDPAKLESAPLASLAATMEGASGAEAAGAVPTRQDAPRSVGEPTAALPVPPPDPNQVIRTHTMGRPGRTLRLTGAAMAGVGLASAAAGVYFSMRVRAIEDEAGKALQMGRSLDHLAQDGAAAERRQNIAYFIAGGLIIGGAVTYIVGYRKDRGARTTALAPAVGPGFAGIVLGGSLP